MCALKANVHRCGLLPGVAYSSLALPTAGTVPFLRQQGKGAGSANVLGAAQSVLTGRHGQLDTALSRGIVAYVCMSSPP